MFRIAMNGHYARGLSLAAMVQQHLYEALRNPNLDVREAVEYIVQITPAREFHRAVENHLNFNREPGRLLPHERKDRLTLVPRFIDGKQKMLPLPLAHAMDANPNLIYNKQARKMLERFTNTHCAEAGITKGFWTIAVSQINTHETATW